MEGIGLKLWRLWCKALGKKALDNDREADYVAGIRTIIFISYFATNLFIVAGVVRHWNDLDKTPQPSYNMNCPQSPST
jgi:hypothetical protein